MQPQKQSRNINGVEISSYQNYKNPEFIDEKSHGEIYRISDTEVAKIPKWMPEIGREMKIAIMLYESGISVPEPRGWEVVSVPQEFDEPRKAFVMEFIEGYSRNALYERYKAKEYALAKELVEEETKKAEQLGFNPGFDRRNEGNYILTPDKKIKLIDFTAWYHPDVPELKRRWDGKKITFENLIDPEEVFN
ncbi:MAG: hypothetical protein Q8N63_06920 [Nanoarchaeota archaeon]|nr:hypothetical protein [Nanoarchaeota archaeon]